MENSLEIVVKNSGLETVEGQTIIEKFGNYEKIAKEWETKAKMIVVTDASQTTEMAMAKEARKHFSDLRIDVEKARVAMKEQSLRKGQAIDAVARFLVSLIKPIEDHLKEQEDFIKIQEAKKAEELRLAEEKRIEEERLAREKLEAEEREKIRIENEKLRKELEEKEKLARIEREEAQRKLDEQRRLAEAEKNRLENEKRHREEEVKKQQEEAQRKQKELEEKLANLVECPKCHHRFSINHSQK